MTNAEIAKILREIGDILELQGESPFRVRAYQQSAKTIEFHPESLARVYEAGGREALEAIPGVGEAIADKIIELLETGRLYYYEQLQTKLPKAELAIAGIPGVGPKTAQKLYELFKPKDIDDLKQQLEQLPKNTQGERSLGPFHEKTIQKVLRGIDVLANLGQRMTLSDAQPIAELFLNRLEKTGAADHIDPVGSLRRSRETIGDIDLIAASNKPEFLIEAFANTPGVNQIIARGATKAMVMFQGRAHVDLEILPKAEYGSLLQHFTGSKEHNIAMRTYAESLGLSFSEHGFKILDAKHPQAQKMIVAAKKAKRWDEKRQMILCEKEDDVYATIGLPWIAPELRENTGELEAARANTLPKLIELADIRGDIHVHSNRSGDGREEPARIIERAIALGYEYIGITEHTVGLGVAGKLSNKELLAHAMALRKLGERYRGEITVLPGCELNILADGSLDVPDDILAELDVVVASVHSAFAQSPDKMTGRILKALDNPHVDILAHPTTRIINYREEIQPQWDEIFTHAAATKTALEINAYPERLDLDGSRIRTAKKFGCQFVISTDAHQLVHLDNMRYGVAMARRGWAEKSDILNTRSAKEFTKWLSRPIGKHKT